MSQIDICTVYFIKLLTWSCHLFLNNLYAFSNDETSLVFGDLTNEIPFFLFSVRFSLMAQYFKLEGSRTSVEKSVF